MTGESKGVSPALPESYWLPSLLIQTPYLQLPWSTLGVFSKDP